MAQFDRVLKLYAENGLRTIEDWVSLGRDLKENVSPRLEVEACRQMMSLYTRDQTQLRAVTRGMKA